MEEKTESLSETEEVDEAEPEKRPRMLTKRKLGIVIAVIVIGVALVIGLWGMAPPDYPTVSEIVGNVNAHINKSIDVMGSVDDWNSSARTFNLTDGESTLLVAYSNVPEGFNNGKDVVVRGTLRDDDGPFIESKEITVGCPSKY